MMIWWVLMALGGVAALWAALSSWRRRKRNGDMGTLSDQWMAEQRMANDFDRNR